MQKHSAHAVFFRLSSLGDVALTTGPLLAWHNTTGMRFTVLTLPLFAPLFEGHPAVHEVIALEKKDMRGARLFYTAREIAEKFAGSAFIDCHGNSRSRVFRLLWPLYAHAPVYVYPKAGLMRRVFLYARPLRGRMPFVSLQKSVPERYAAALPDAACAGQNLAPHIFLTESEKMQAQTALVQAGLPIAPITGVTGVAPVVPVVPVPPVTGGAGAQSSSGAFSATAALPGLRATSAPVLALHPFATHINKTWPWWEELAALLFKQGIPFFWVGREKDYRGQFAALGPDFINCLSLRELCAYLSCADVLLSADSGPVHLARAVHTQVVALFGPTCREWGFFPAGEEGLVLQQKLPCQPCSLHGGASCRFGQRCMRTLEPAYVLWQTLSHLNLEKDFL